MEHVVFYPGPDGGPGFRRVGSLDEAVALVERLRNVDDLTDSSVHALTRVPLSVRTCYKVQLPQLAASPALPDPVVDDMDDANDDVEVADSFPLPADAVPTQGTPAPGDGPEAAEPAPRPGLGIFTS